VFLLSRATIWTCSVFAFNELNDDDDNDDDDADVQRLPKQRQGYYRHCHVLQILLHDPSEHPLMIERGLKVSPGFSTQIAVTVENVSLTSSKGFSM